MKTNVYVFLIKTQLYAGLGPKQKTFSNCQATCQKELCLLFEEKCFTEQTYRYTSLPPPVCFYSLFNDPLPLHNKHFLNDLENGMNTLEILPILHNVWPKGPEDIYFY